MKKIIVLSLVAVSIIATFSCEKSVEGSTTNFFHLTIGGNVYDFVAPKDSIFVYREFDSTYVIHAYDAPAHTSTLLFNIHLQDSLIGRTRAGAQFNFPSEVYMNFDYSTSFPTRLIYQTNDSAVITEFGPDPTGFVTGTLSGKVINQDTRDTMPFTCSFRATRKYN